MKTRRRQKNREREFLDSIKQAEPTRALQHLYEILEEQPRFEGPRLEKVVTLDAAYRSDTECTQLLQRLKKQCYGPDTPPGLSVDEAKRLLGYLKERLPRPWPWQEPIGLSLNSAT
jgi:hypothetical protein